MWNNKMVIMLALVHRVTFFKSHFNPFSLIPGVLAQAGNRRPPQRLDHLQWQEQRVLWLAVSDGEQGVPQRRPEHRGNGGKTKEGTRSTHNRHLAQRAVYKCLLKTAWWRRLAFIFLKCIRFELKGYSFLKWKVFPFARYSVCIQDATKCHIR